MESRKVSLFKNDQWVTVDIADLKAGDQIYHLDRIMEVVSDPIEKEGGIYIDVRPLSNKEDVNDNVSAMDETLSSCYAIAHIMDMIEVDLTGFTDGQVQVVKMMEGGCLELSPKMSAPDLDEFCEKNTDKIIQRYNEAVESERLGQNLGAEKWWLH